MKILYLLFQYYLLFRIYQMINMKDINNIENSISKRKLSDSNLNTLNDLIYIYENDDKLSYITNTKKENGDIYITINSEKSNSSNRFLYIIKADNAIDNKTIEIDSVFHNKYPLSSFLYINNYEYLVTFSHEGAQFEIIDYNQENIYYYSIFKVIKYNSFIQKNIFTRLKFYNNSDYIFNAYIDKHNSNFLIQKLFFVDYNTKFKITCTEKNIGNAFINSTVTCFEIDNFLECLYTNSVLLYTVSVFNITNFDNIYNETIEENTVKYSELFSKCIYIKKNIGAYIYFTDNNHFPIIQFKNLIVNNNIYYLNNIFDPININSQSSLSLGSNYIYNDIIKTNDNNIFYISTSYESIIIFYSLFFILYVILFKLLNYDKNILISNYEIKINSNCISH